MAAETARSIDDAELVTIKIEGLWKAGGFLGERYTKELRIRKDKLVRDLWSDLQALGYEAPDYLRGKSLYLNDLTTVERVPPPDIIEVIQDGQSEAGKSIHIHEPLIAFANRSLNGDLEVNVGKTGETLSVELAGSMVNMSLQRTARMPDDEKLHQLPPSLGQFRLHNREAMWINFGVQGFEKQARRFALRVFVGQINAISGAKMKNDEEEKDTELMGRTQDYAVVPGRQWLDGICVAPGVVRQFVAMPLGSGYTVESQKTGEEKFGGLQIEVIPSYEQRLKRWTEEQANPKFDGNAVYLDEFMTPSELGLAPGDKLKAYLADPPRSLANMADLAEDISHSNQAMMADYSLHLYANCRGSDDGLHALSLHGFGGAPPSLEHSSRSALGGEHRQLARISSSVAYGPPLAYGPSEYGPLQKRTVQSANLHAMGLAAGGKLIQDIYKDELPAGIWNINAARVLHIHILDPQSFEAVTHIVPRPPPVDAKGAKETISYYVVEEQIDDRLDGGDFDKVVSVSGMDKKTGIVTEPSLDPLKPTMCGECETRLDYVTALLEKNSQDENGSRSWKCPTCRVGVSHVAGFAAPMNLPGEETVRERVPVRVLKIDDGRAQFRSIQRARV